MTEEAVGSKVFFTPAALRDIEEVWDHIAEDSPAAATRVVDTILSSVAHLTEFPRMGHLRDGLAYETLRIWPVYSYLIIYRPAQESIEIIRIVSGVRDLEALFPEDWSQGQK